MARADEIPPGTRKLVCVGGRSIGVFNIAGRFYALRNSCPHQGAELCLGSLFAPLRSSAPGSYEREAEPTIIRCPWHGWEFDVRTGRSWCDPETQRVRAYPTRLREQADPARVCEQADPARVCEQADPARMREQPDAEDRPAARRVDGELRAERYPARRAGPWVVVDLGGASPPG